METTSAEEVREWTAWEGPPERLVRLAEVMESLLSEDLKEALRSVDRKEELDRERDPPTDTSERRERERERIREEYTTDMTMIEEDMNLTREGSVQEVLERADFRFLKRLWLRTPSSFAGENQIDVTLDKFGCSLTVKGEDRRWIKSAADVLESEIRRDVPSWAWFRSGWGAAIVTVLVTLVATLLGIRLTARVSPKDEVSFVLAVASLGLLFGVPIYFGLLRFLPAVQVVNARNPSKSSRALGFLFALALLPAAVVVESLIHWAVGD